MLNDPGRCLRTPLVLFAVLTAAAPAFAGEGKLTVEGFGAFGSGRRGTMFCTGRRPIAGIGLSASLLVAGLVASPAATAAPPAVVTAVPSEATTDRLRAIELDALENLAGDTQPFLVAQSARSLPMTLDQVRVFKRDRQSGNASTVAAPAKTAKPKIVDCTKGQNIQSVIDQGRKSSASR